VARETTEVLIVGAGPTGLILALWLARLGIRIRIIDKVAEPGTTSRALAVQIRTLELYRQLGIADEVIDAGLKFRTANLWVHGRRAVRVEFGDARVLHTPYPYALIYPQDEHERFLIDKLGRLGVHVERETALQSFEEQGDRVLARFERSECEAAFIAGCDGARSTVREQLGVGFPGGTYEHLFYVADVDASGPQVDHELHLSLDTSDFLAVFPIRAENRVRLIGTVRREAEADEKLEWEDVDTDILQLLRLDVHRVNWFSTYRVHHRVASHFSRGRVFLLGDAAHIHSPVGGQGMNTGLGDAINLAWKFAAVLRGRAPVTILNTYEQERVAFARRLVATTDRVFQFVTKSGPIAGFVRVHVAPHVIGAAFRIPAVRQFLQRTVSQTAIEYRDSALSEGSAGRIRGGDRLPWTEEPDNFAPLQSLDWQVHVYGSARGTLTSGIPVHVFPWTRGAEAAGLARDAMYLIRPDGHVALADPSQNPARLRAYFQRLGMT
jgi:2-polyprenyl-6-methoxyphenol hydroxylase-like FAD-dependent oxidoreductase